MAERNESIARDDDASERKLSYKFQRLRERIRAAIDGGELVGKLPGERTLARQFNVNAKTLSKALTDLAAEGVLERNIGLGTFVRGHVTTTAATNALLLADAEQADGLLAALAAVGVQASAELPNAELPPSLIAPFRIVLVASDAVPDDVVRGLLVRGKDVITIDRLSTPYSTHALMPHVERTATQAALEIAGRGVANLLFVADEPSVVETVRAAVPHVEVRTASANEVAAAVHDGFSVILCQADQIATAKAALPTPEQDGQSAVTFFGFGRCGTVPRVPGVYVTDAMVATAVADLLAAGLPHKPLTAWLAGQRVDGAVTA